MQFCDDCGTTMVKVDDSWICKSCEPEKLATSSASSDHRTADPRSAKVTNLPTTESGSVQKSDAMKWLDSLDKPTASEVQQAVLPKPKGFTGSTYPTSISNIRITGDPEFIETIAGLLKPIQELEGARTRVEINLQKTENRDTGELTDNYALYLSVAERG